MSSVLHLQVSCQFRRSFRLLTSRGVRVAYVSSEIIISGRLLRLHRIHVRVGSLERATQTHRLKLYGNCPACRAGHIGVLWRCSQRRWRDGTGEPRRRGSMLPGTTPSIICHSAPLCRPKTRNRVSRTST